MQWSAFTMRRFSITLAILLIAVTGSVLADSTSAQPSSFVDWATVALGMGTIVITLMGGILVHVNSQLTKISDQLWERMLATEQQVDSLHKTLLREYHTKDDLREMLSITLRPILEQLTRLTTDMDAVYRELLRSNKRRGDTTDEHIN